MLPSELTPAAFGSYPPEARKIAVSHLELLKRLPASFLPLLLRELIGYDWKFPAERKEIDDQLAFLGSSAPDIVQPFAALAVPADLLESDWISDPAGFSEKWSAHLWAAHQMDGFRTASVDYMRKAHSATAGAPLPVNRLLIVLIGRGVANSTYPLFRKLNDSGVRFTNVVPAGGLEAVTRLLQERAGKYPVPFAHWWVDGGDQAPSGNGFESLAYGSLTPVRAALIQKMIATMRPGGGGPELLRTELARLTPRDVGLTEGVISRFQLSLLTEGSGTQIFSTTFVQWTARELLRRAQPLTLVARYAPRQREAAVQPVNHPAELDAEGALIDADMGAYYTWINQQRLSGAEQARALVWFEDHSDALAIVPGWKAGTVEASGFSVREILARLV